MEKRGLVDVKAKRDHFERRRHQLNNLKSEQEITLIEISTSDVEVLDEDSLGGEEIKIDEDYRKEVSKKRGREGEVVRRKRFFGGSNFQEEMLPRTNYLASKGEAGGHKGDFSNCKEKLPTPCALLGGEWERRRDGAQVDFEKMLKSRRKESVDSGELGSLVNKCSVREKLAAPLKGEGVKVSSCGSFKTKKSEVNVEAEDSGYISKVDGSEEDVRGDAKQTEEVVVVVDLCRSSKSNSEASASTNTDDSSVEMVGEVLASL